MNVMGLKVGLRPVKDKSKGEGTVKKRGRESEESIKVKETLESS